MTEARLSKEDVKEFLFGQALHAFDPETNARVATVKYHEDGTCHLVLEDGSSDEGLYGFQGDLYWTKYNRFRDGGLNRFFLQRIDDHTAQAYFEDGTRAFLQSPKAELG